MCYFQSTPWLPATPHFYRNSYPTGQKTASGVFSGSPSGRLSRRSRFRSMFTPGSRACGYKTASGLGKWPNRDPLGDAACVQLYLKDHHPELLTKHRLPVAEVAVGPNLFEFDRNDPIDRIDDYGLCCDDSSLHRCKWSCLALGTGCAAVCTATTGGWGLFFCVSACAALEHGCEDDCEKEWCK